MENCGKGSVGLGGPLIFSGCRLLGFELRIFDESGKNLEDSEGCSNQEVRYARKIGF